jgi:hypothetical protein
MGFMQLGMGFSAKDDVIDLEKYNMDLVLGVIYDFELSLTKIIKSFAILSILDLGNCLCRSLSHLNSCAFNALKEVE